MSTIVTRAGKGSALTHVEVDANFTNLNTDKIQSGNTVASLTITSATINGGTITGITDLAVADGGTGTSTAFTTGSVVFAGASGIYTQDNANFFWDDTNNRLGVGTASPQLRFHTVGGQGAVASFPTLSANSTAIFENNLNTKIALINSGGAGVASSIQSYASGDTVPRAELQFVSDISSINFLTGNTARMRINSSGNVGIGTTSPDANLTVNGAASFAAGTALLPSIARASDLNTGIFFPAADTIAFAEGGAESMRITSAGNVGIGQTTVAAKLGIGQSSSTAYNLIAQTPTVGLTAGDYVNMAYFTNARSTNNDGLRIVNLRDSTGASIGDWETESYRIRRSVDQNDGTSGVQEEIVFGNALLAFNTNGTERMRIDSSGNVGIGTTSPATKFQVSGASGSLNARINAGNTGLDITNNDSTGVTDLATTPLGGGGKVMSFTMYNGSSSAERMRIDSSGNVLVGTTTTAGAASNNALVVGGVFNSLNGTTASLANGASASIVTSTASLSFYQVFANCVGNTTVFASALIYFNGAGTATVQSIMGTGMSISSSGANIITVTNSAGSSQQISWTVTRYK